jgi:hypothetical protein
MPRIQTLPCPGCGERIMAPITNEEYERLQRGDLIQKALPNHSADTRERFVSGYCSPCWDELFLPEE